MRACVRACVLVCMYVSMHACMPGCVLTCLCVPHPLPVSVICSTLLNFCPFTFSQILIFICVDFQHVHSINGLADGQISCLEHILMSVSLRTDHKNPIKIIEREAYYLRVTTLTGSDHIAISVKRWKLGLVFSIVKPIVLPHYVGRVKFRMYSENSNF